MKGKLLIIGLVLCFSIQAKAQLFNGLNYQQGYIITYSDSLYGYIARKDFNTGKIKFKEDKNTKKVSRIHPKEIVKIVVQNETFEKVKYDRERRFVKLLVDGKIKLYEDKFSGTGASIEQSGLSTVQVGQNYTTRVFIVDDGYTPIPLRKKRFKQNLKVMMEDQSEIAKKVDELNFYTFPNSLIHLIEEYNSKHIHISH